MKQLGFEIVETAKNLNNCSFHRSSLACLKITK